MATAFQEKILEVVRHRGLPMDMDHFVLPDNPSILITKADSLIVQRLYWLGEKAGWEPEVVYWWRRFCRVSDNVLELGANIGYFCVQGAKANPSAAYTAVEPHPGAAQLLRKNLALNGISSVRVVEAAAVDVKVADEMELSIAAGDHFLDAPCSGFVNAGDSPSSYVVDGDAPSIAVATTELRTFFQDEIHLIKIDVEGQEHRLLSSVSDEISGAKPTLFLEMLDGTPKLRSLICQLCDTNGYRCFVPVKDRLIPLETSEISTVSLVDRFATRDVVLVSEGNDAHFSLTP